MGNALAIKKYDIAIPLTFSSKTIYGKLQIIGGKKV